MEQFERPGPSSMNLVPSMAVDDLFNRRLCIICQEDTKLPVTSEKQGRESMKRAAEIRNDGVTKRIKSIADDDEDDDDIDKFVYHNTNKCYKSYTHSSKLKSISEKIATAEVLPTCDTGQLEAGESVGLRKTLRKNISPCAPPSCEKDPRTLPCVICGNIQHKKCREKFRICEYDSAKKIIDAAKYNEDELFIRIADRLKDDEDGSVKSLVSADLYCHHLCRQSYMRQYERDIKVEAQEKSLFSNIKYTLFTRALPYIDRMLAKGDCCSMSEIVQFTSSLLEEGEVLPSTFRNRDIKNMIISHYGESIIIAPNSRVNEPDIFYSSNVDAADLAIKLKNQNIMAEAGIKMREALMDVDFGLQDSFCDSADLKASWQKAMMPASVLTFFSALFNVPKHKLFQSTVEDLEELLQPLEVQDDEPVEELFIPQQEQSTQSEQHSHNLQPKPEPQKAWVIDHKSTQLHCLFQMIVFNIHNGRKKTPLHMMLGHSIYARDRSRSLLTVFNRIGSCASYQTIRSARSLLANYAIKCSEDGETPIPSTLTREDYTMAGMDNSDYADKSSLSGTKSSHYAALVLFQDATLDRQLHKPPVSRTGLRHGDPIIGKHLSCQEVHLHSKPVLRPTLPADMLLDPENKQASLLDMQTAQTVAAKREFFITLIRIGASAENPPIWAAVHTLISPTVVPIMRVGFLPVIPRPITERATVRHCLTNFQSVCKQLNQTSIAVWCDEGVFAIACDIYLHETEQFKNVFLCLGPFHWTRVLLRCQGKLLRGSGLDDALIECAVFGPGVIESVLNGSHYVRALTGMLIVEDVIRSLQWKIFWNNKNTDAYPVLTQLQDLQMKLSEKQRCPEQFNALTGEVEELYQDFREFEKECEAKSELCQFFGVWLKLVAIIKNAVVSEREGNWNLHAATVEESMPIFAECDCVNYLRYGSWYLERIKVLEFTHPELYRRFSMGQWVVQDRPGWFCAVGGDMKVEQTIQRVSKGPGGHYVVGETRNATAVAEFELLFHEIGSITSLLNCLTSNNPMQHTECHLQHSLSTTRRFSFNQNVSKLLDFVLVRKNPYSLTVNVPVPLHNLITNLAVHRQVARRLLNFHENGEHVYRSYRGERLVEKTKKISMTISKSKLPKFTDQPQKPQSTTTIEKDKNDLSPKDMAVAQRNMDIAKERGMDIRQILTHNILSTSPLFEGDLPAHPNKSLLVAEIEPKLDLTQWSPESTLDTHIVIDFMSKIRQMPVAKFLNLGTVIDVIMNSASCLSKNVKFIHVVLDSYIEMSLKEGERLRRTDSTIGIDIIGMNRDTPIPQQLEKFWASQENKRNLQLLVRDIVCRRAFGEATIIASSLVSDDEALPAIATGGEEIHDLLNWIEEADARLVVHVDWAVRVQHCERVVVVSNDTDTFALLLHYTPYFQEHGLKEIWQQYGTGERRRMLPIHQAVSQLGSSLAKTVIKAHILTGDDCMSKVGTKHAAMSCDPVQYLTNFGETDMLLEHDAVLAEKYLVRVWAGARSTTTCETFDQLRLESYISARVGIDALPPTSSEIRGHIQRGAYLAHKACHLLTTVDEQEKRLEPLEHGWEEHLDALLPSKCLKSLPQNMIKICKCSGNCSTQRCGCRLDKVLCVVFCHGRMENLSCKNNPCKD